MHYYYDHITKYGAQTRGDTTFSGPSWNLITMASLLTTYVHPEIISSPFSFQVMANRKTATQMLAEACGKPFDEVLEDSSRTFYLSPDEAVEYGLIDKVTSE